MLSCKGLSFYDDKDYSIALSFNPYVETRFVDQELYFTQIPQDAHFFVPCWREKLTGYYCLDRYTHFIHTHLNYRGKVVIPKRECETVTWRYAGKKCYGDEYYTYGFLAPDTHVPKCCGQHMYSTSDDISYEWRCVCGKTYRTPKPYELVPESDKLRFVLW